jgi:hypothetical protein
LIAERAKGSQAHRLLPFVRRAIEPSKMANLPALYLAEKYGSFLEFILVESTQNLILEWFGM